jgi:hypothetical protein
MSFGQLDEGSVVEIDKGVQAMYRAHEQLELVHGNLCGLVTPAALGVWRYFLLLVDDTSCFMWAVPLPPKDVAADAI